MSRAAGRASKRTNPLADFPVDARKWAFLKHPDLFVDASRDTQRPLALPPTRRQFATARDILQRFSGANGNSPRFGLLLSDDVGLGKTTVAALVAWVVAARGDGTVRILAPNDVMRRRWEEELRRLAPLVQECTGWPEADAARIKGKVTKLLPGRIQVVRYASALTGNSLACSLLIVDEAHRAKGEDSQFGRALRKHKKSAGRMLILTATPFSIAIDELLTLLDLIGASGVRSPVKHYRQELDRVYGGVPRTREPDAAAKELINAARNAVEAISPYVIRHGVEGLPKEQRHFGARATWEHPHPEATAQDLETLVRADRLLRLAKRIDASLPSATNDPRFHVGWAHLDAERTRVEHQLPRASPPVQSVVRHHVERIKQLREKSGPHPKVAGVARLLRDVVTAGERVVLFCHHHATAIELTLHLARQYPAPRYMGVPKRSVWVKAWASILQDARGDGPDPSTYLPLARWLASDVVLGRIRGVVPARIRDHEALKQLLQRTSVAALYPKLGQSAASEEPSFAGAAVELYERLLSSRSSVRVLGTTPEFEPLRVGRRRVVCVGRVADGGLNDELFVHHQQPDTILALLNSPFGPQIAVVTDALSEGVDLHRYCRHLVHFELDPSPVRTLQREGRLRRVQSWAARSGQPMCVAYPAFKGTRDERLVTIMGQRLRAFGLLLGGAPAIGEDIDDHRGTWEAEVVSLAATSLRKLGDKLKADP